MTKQDFRDDAGVCVVPEGESFLSAHHLCAHYQERRLFELKVCEYCQVVPYVKCTRPEEEEVKND